MTKSDSYQAVWCLGLMSGTSLDGVDAALIKTDGHRVYEFGPSYYLTYPEEFRNRIKAYFGTEKAEDVPLELVHELTDYHMEAVRYLMEVARMTASQIAYIGFHGQTIHHDPAKGITVQIGDGQRLSDTLGIPVVYDFRTADVKAGGEGAPLAPVYHQALAQDAEKPLAILNIGGVSNVTYIDEARLIAFDTGPGNAFMDDMVLKETGASFDEDGKLARQGQVDQSRLSSWFANSFFQRTYPKSLDRDEFKQVDVADLDLKDALATLAQFSAKAIGKGRDCLPERPTRWLVTGGGRKNGHLMELLSQELDGEVAAIETADWDGDAMEAQAFAFLAIRAAKGLPISFPETTGVAEPKTGGVLVRPKLPPV